MTKLYKTKTGEKVVILNNSIPAIKDNSLIMYGRHELDEMISRGELIEVEQNHDL